MCGRRDDGEMERMDEARREATRERAYFVDQYISRRVLTHLHALIQMCRLKKEFQITGKDERTFVNGTSKVRLQTDASSANGLPYKLLPFIDQKEMYGSVYTRLKAGGCIGIFPEGDFSSLVSKILFLVLLTSFESINWNNSN